MLNVTVYAKDKTKSGQTCRITRGSLATCWGHLATRACPLCWLQRLLFIIKKCHTIGNEIPLPKMSWGWPGPTVPGGHPVPLPPHPLLQAGQGLPCQARPGKVWRPTPQGRARMLGPMPAQSQPPLYLLAHTFPYLAGTIYFLTHSCIPPLGERDSQSRLLSSSQPGWKKGHKLAHPAAQRAPAGGCDGLAQPREGGGDSAIGRQSAGCGEQRLGGPRSPLLSARSGW